MSKISGPLLSMRARGQVGKSAVFAQWRGVPYVRQYAIPANPRTQAQQEIRNPFRWLQDAYRSIPGNLAAVYEAFTEGRPMIPRNGWTRINLAALQSQTDITNITFSPGARGGPAPSAINATPGAGQISVGVTPPALPTGWTIAAAHAVALMDQDPQSQFLPPWASGSDTSSPYSITLTGLQSSTAYVVGAWLEYIRPDGSAAYSASLQAVATPT